jgi:hypothetical protein
MASLAHASQLAKEQADHKGLQDKVRSNLTSR